MGSANYSFYLPWICLEDEMKEIQISHVKKLARNEEALSFEGMVAVPFPIPAFVTDLRSAHGGWDALSYGVIIITHFFLNQRR